LANAVVPNVPVKASPFPSDRVYLPLVLASTLSLRPEQKQVVPTDEFLSRPLGVLNIDNLTRSARVRLEVEMEHRPSALPPGVDDPEQCIQRNWYLDLKTQNAELRLSLVLDYLQENSNHHELGASIKEGNEKDLRLWLNQNQTWTQLRTKNNTLANTFTTQILNIKPGSVMHFVACLSS
jgi:hypothetical protein